jgi:hypothetical protein
MLARTVQLLFELTARGSYSIYLLTSLFCLVTEILLLTSNRFEPKYSQLPNANVLCITKTYYETTKILQPELFYRNSVINYAYETKWHNSHTRELGI